MDGLTFVVDSFAVLLLNLSIATGWSVVNRYLGEAGDERADIENKSTGERVNGLPVEHLLTSE